MELREVYEKSIGKPWEVNGLWVGGTTGFFFVDHDEGDSVIPDWLASAAMEQAMVRYVLDKAAWVKITEANEAVEKGSDWITSLLLACQSLHEGAKRE